MLKIITRHKRGCGKRKGCGCPLHLHGTINGQRVRESLHTSSMSIARQRQAKRELEILTGKKQSRVTVAEAVEAFMGDTGRRGFARSTIAKYQRFCKRIEDAYGRRLLESIDTADMRDFVGGWTQGPQAQQKQLEHLKSFWSFCVDSGWIERNPAGPIRGPKIPPPQINPFTVEEFIAMLDACESFGKKPGERARMRAFVSLLWFTGLSIGDAARLPKAAVKGLRIATARKKNGEGVYMPIPAELATMLESFPHTSTEYFFWTGAGDPDNVATLYQRRIRRIFDLAGLSDATSRRFRQTVASKLAAVGIEHAQHGLGHASVRTTEKHYAGWTPERQAVLTDAAARAFGDEPSLIRFGTPQTHGEDSRAN